ncbi:IS200/IS605 family accessory protein TnpB-related protein [Nonomuraea muscovyensis]|uniref:IS200/IS605 family accessory protein TnpB-related protein n=1 Tax=Nonomuraea muscovyensis TaxID=1124761 RepID=UPI0033F3D74F
MLRLVGAHLGRLASRDLAQRCRAGLEHSNDMWAARKREVTALSSSRWAGSITKATHHQWGLSRRAQWAHLQSLRAGIAMLRHRLSLPIGEKGSRRKPGGYRSGHEWFCKSRRLAHLEREHDRVLADHQAGRVRVVRGGHTLLNTRHNLCAADLSQERWRQRWDSARRFLAADGESGKKFGNETIRVTPEGEVSIKLPTPLRHLANTKHGRYALSARVSFPHRGSEWHDRIETNRAVAYRIHLDIQRDRWYLDASWQRKDLPRVPLETLRAGQVIGIDMNADHLAAWRLDTHGNPIAAPRTFAYRLRGTADHRDAQIRHAITRLLHWAEQVGCRVIAIEDLDFTDSKTREKHGRGRRFRQIISGMPTGKLRTRLLAMTAEYGISIIAVDPAYTSRWGAEHWQRPLTNDSRPVTRHQAASVAIARRALGHRIRRRTTPPHHDQSDRGGHRIVQARPGVQEREGTRPPQTGSRTRSVPPTVGANAGDQPIHDRSGWAQCQIDPYDPF